MCEQVRRAQTFPIESRPTLLFCLCTKLVPHRILKKEIEGGGGGGGRRRDEIETLRSGGKNLRK